MTLEKSSGGRAWDQFAVNERQFGIKTTYDENLYTTAIDKSHPQYKERLARAEKAAKEIEGSAAITAHHAEERQMDFAGSNDAGGDEEEK
jgi:PAB1-binding protein PBP1